MPLTPQFPPLPLQPGQMLPAPGRAALLLDLDGTLLDIAPGPDQVVVPVDLRAHLLAARTAVGEALAIISGRPIAQIDALLPGVPFAVAGEHGSAIRPAPHNAIRRAALPELSPAWFAQAERLTTAHPGAMLERKAHGFVVHYRAAPAAGPGLEPPLRALVDQNPEFTLVRALMAWEIRPVGADKGTAVDALMRQAPFAGRAPIFVGDDVTDEDGMRACRTHGGLGLRVAEAFGSAQAVRAWLADLSTASSHHRPGDVARVDRPLQQPVVPRA